jgi:hypothetical protein
LEYAFVAMPVLYWFSSLAGNQRTLLDRITNTVAVPR